MLLVLGNKSIIDTTNIAHARFYDAGDRYLGGTVDEPLLIIHTTAIQAGPGSPEPLIVEATKELAEDAWNDLLDVQASEYAELRKR
jgi:hypothetical protein